MAATATAQPRASRERPVDRLVEVAVIGGMVALAVASVLPLLLVAIVVYGTLYALRRQSWRIRGRHSRCACCLRLWPSCWPT
jgi:hypothetical protein